MKFKALILGLVVLTSCTKTITVFSSKTKFAKKERFLVLKPQVALTKFEAAASKAMLGTFVSELGSRGYSHKVAWSKMSEVYKGFTAHLYAATKKVYQHKSNSVEEVVKEESWGENLMVNLTLLGKNWSEAMVKQKMDPFSPRYVFVSGLEKVGETFTGNLKLIIYGALIDTREKSVVWGMSFNFKSPATSHDLAIKAIVAGREMMKEFHTWLQKSK